MSLEAKWQLIHTNGIWTEVEGTGEEAGPASRKRSSLITTAATFHHAATPRCGNRRSLMEPLPNWEHASPGPAARSRHSWELSSQEADSTSRKKWGWEG